MPKARAEWRRAAPRGLGVGRRCPLPTGEGPGEEAVPLPQKNSIFGFQIATLGAFWGLFLWFNGLFGTICDASLITEYRPYAATLWCLTVTFIPSATLLYSQKYSIG